MGDATPIAALLALDELGMHIDAVGSRLVYGGLDHEAPAAVTAELMTSLNELVPFDPLHLPGALAPGGEIGSAWPRAAKSFCFDTAFHRGKPEVAQRLLLPCEPWSRGVRRYGFHGFSYQFIVNELGDVDGLETFVYWRYRRTEIAGSSLQTTTPRRCPRSSAQRRRRNGHFR